MGANACCPQRSPAAIESTPPKDGLNRMQEIQKERKSSVATNPGPSVVLYLEGLECLCPTDPTGDNMLIMFIAGISVCAIAGGVFGTFVPKSLGFDDYEPMCTAAAATIFTVVFSSICDSNGLLESSEEEVNASADVNGVLVKGAMTGEQFTVYREEGQLDLEEWVSEEDDQVIFKVNEEAVVGGDTNLCHQTNMKSGDFIKIDRTFTPKNNRFLFELEEWDFTSDNNKLIPSPAGLYRVDKLKSTLDFTRGSANPGLYLVSTANKSIYIVYGRLEVKE